MLIYCSPRILVALKVCPFKSVTSLSASYIPTSGEIIAFKVFSPRKSPIYQYINPIKSFSCSPQSKTEFSSSKTMCTFSPALSTEQREWNWWWQKQCNYLSAWVLLISTAALAMHWNWRFCMVLGWKYCINSVWRERHNVKCRDRIGTLVIVHTEVSRCAGGSWLKSQKEKQPWGQSFS